MGIRLYELAGAESDRRFSPYCWRIHLALLHKGLAFETVPWRFTEKEAIAFAGAKKVPVLTDGDHAVHDSPEIAAYLEHSYPDRPSLFDGPGGEALSRFIVDWCDQVVAPFLFRMLVADIAKHVAPEDIDYFRASREAVIGTTLEECSAGAADRVPEFRKLLTPVRKTLTRQPFLCGDHAAWADYVLFGVFQWARCVSPLKLLAEDDPVYRWRDRMLGLFDGVAAKAKGYAV